MTNFLTHQIEFPIIDHFTITLKYAHNILKDIIAKTFAPLGAKVFKFDDSHNDISISKKNIEQEPICSNDVMTCHSNSTDLIIGHAIAAATAPSQNNYTYKYKWQINYLLFNLENALFSISPKIIFKPKTANILSWLMPALQGAIIQGNDDCGAQKKIFKDNRFLSYVAGFVNGLICKGVDHVFASAISAIGNVVGAPAIGIKIAQVATFCLNSYLSSIYMCKIESKIYQHFSSKNNNFSSEKKDKQPKQQFTSELLSSKEAADNCHTL